jgi:uncharacterized membrane protein
MHASAKAIIALFIAFVGAAPAFAGLTICNKTPYQVKVAAAWFHNDPPGVSTGGDEGGQISGWATIDPNACQLVTRQVARDGQFYYYAHTSPNSTHEWTSTSRLCVSSQAFQTMGLFLHAGQGCAAGWKDRGFKRAQQASTVEQTVNLLMGD